MDGPPQGLGVRVGCLGCWTWGEKVSLDVDFEVDWIKGAILGAWLHGGQQRP